MRFAPQIITGLLLIGLFLLVYLWASNIKAPALPEGFTAKPQAIGAIGGFHLLDDVEVRRHAQFDTVAIYTQLNRSSILEGIETPSTTLAIGGTTKSPILELTMADTQFSEELSPADINRISQQTINGSPIREIIVSKTPDSSIQQVKIRLSRSSQYRLSSDPRKPGTIYLDILK